VPPTKITSAVKIIGIEATLAIKFLNSRLGRLTNRIGGSEVTAITSAPEIGNIRISVGSADIPPSQNAVA